MSNTDDLSNLLPEGVDIELLKDLERQNLEAIRHQRKHARFEVSVPVLLKPGNASAPPTDAFRGTSKDLSEGGCMIQFPRPVYVGDVFRLTFEDEALDVPEVFARSRRCIMIREGVFEVGFSFFNPISLELGGGASNEAPKDLI